MFEGIPLGWFGIGSGWALFSLSAWFLLTGRVVTKNSVTEYEKRVESQMADLRDRVSEWREAYGLERKAREIQTQQLNELLAIWTATSSNSRPSKEFKALSQEPA